MIKLCGVTDRSIEPPPETQTEEKHTKTLSTKKTGETQPPEAQRSPQTPPEPRNNQK